MAGRGVVGVATHGGGAASSASSCLCVCFEVSLALLASATQPLASSSDHLASYVHALLAFMEAFLLVEPANRVALLACTPRGCEWVFEPTGTHGGEDGSDASETTTPLFPEEVPVCGLGEGVSLAEIVTRRLAQLERSGALDEPRTPSLAGALARAVSYVHSQRQRCLMRAAAAAAADGNATNLLKSDSAEAAPGMRDASAARTPLVPRVLCLFGSPDDTSAFKPTMNAIFAAERHGIAIDTIAVGGRDSPYLQQAAHLTRGKCTTLPSALSAELLTCMINTYLPPPHLRANLEEGATSGVDFRASCFATNTPVELGYVCSICLAVYRDKRTKCIACDSSFEPQSNANGGTAPA
ncbi:transcription initiation factor TFIIH subunit 3 [Pycnococcus provasolii]